MATKARKTTTTATAPAVTPPAPPPAAEAPAVLRVEMVRVRVKVAHEGFYRDSTETLLLTPRVQALIRGGVLELLGPATPPPPPVVTIINPPMR